MLFPQLGPQYLGSSPQDNNILARMEAFYAESITINQSFWGEADTDHRFESGDQTLWNDLYGNLPANRRRQFNFNRIRRVIQMISGHQRRNRKSTIVTPIENADNETADQFTKIMMWIEQQENVLETLSEAFQGSLIGGMNLLQVWVDYRSDPISGNIRVDNCSYNSFLIDPYFKKADLSDCNGLWKRSFITKREAVSLLPDKADDIMGLYGVDNRDGKFQFMPEAYNYGLKNLLTYDEFWYRDYRTQKMLVDTQTGETMEWKGKDDEALKQFLQVYPSVTVMDNEVSTVNLAVVVQGRVMYDGPNPMGIDQYPFVPVMAYYRPEMPYFPWRIQGVVRGLRDAQFLYNRRRVIELDILESQIASGFKYKENALVNPKDIFLQGQGRGLALKSEAQMTDVEQIMPPQIPPSMIQLSELLAKEVMEISGVNEELLGSAVDDKAGVLSMLRQGAGLTTLQSLFDQLDRSQKLLGKVIIDLVQANFTPGKVKKILEGEEPTQQFYNKNFGRFDATVEEGLNTTTQKQMQFAQLLQLREVGVQVSDEVLLEAATIQDKKKLVESVAQAARAKQQMEQQQQQVAMQELQARAELSKARAAADTGLYYERTSRVQENLAAAQERVHEAHKEDEIAMLNKIKMLKELETMDIAHLEKLVFMANSLNMQQQQEVGKLEPIAKPERVQSEQGAAPQENIQQPVGQVV
jgi:hypothetical protein